VRDGVVPFCVRRDRPNGEGQGQMALRKLQAGKGCERLEEEAAVVQIVSEVIAVGDVVGSWGGARKGGRV